MSRYDDDYRYYDYDDGLYDKYGKQYAEENADAISNEYMETGILESMLRHRAEVHGSLEKKLERAAKRIAAGDYDEAVFGAYRCLEGYLKAVFLTALFDALTEPFESRLKHVQLRERQLLNDRVFDQPQTVFLGLMAAGASGEIADGILKAIRAFRGRHAENRNTTFHSLDEPDEEAAEKCLDEARNVISAVEAVFAPHVGRRVEAARKASEWAAVVRVYKKPAAQNETPDTANWQEQARNYQIDPQD